MKRLVLITGIALTAAPVFAGLELLPVRGVRCVTYNPATGELTPTAGPTRLGSSVWGATQGGDYYFPSYAKPWLVLDWGDIAGPQYIGAFSFSYGTELVLPERFTMEVAFFADENGENSTGRTFLSGFIVQDLPTGDPDGGFNSWIVTVDLDDAGFGFTIDGNDLDADGLADFGYTFRDPTTEFWEPRPIGPTIAGDPNVVPPTAPGIKDLYDAFSDPWMINYVGSFNFAGDPFAQFYMELFARECPNPGASGNYCTADIDGSGDCIVSLSDLSRLLCNYGTTTGATHGMGDIQPYPSGDGDVDLQDLAELLRQYGDDCN